MSVAGHLAEYIRELGLRVAPGTLAEAILSAIASASAPDRLALARALVADMPGVVVAKVPDAIRYTAISIDAPTNPPSWIAGFNAAISAIITAGSATDVG